MINPLYPYLAASPDGLVECSYCGNGLLEIKCPYNYRDSPVAEVLNDNNLFSKGDTFTLRQEHQYYYQIQGRNISTITKFKAGTSVLLPNSRPA